VVAAWCCRFAAAVCRPVDLQAAYGTWLSSLLCVVHASHVILLLLQPNFSQLVWQTLEEQNADFFRAYNLRVQLKNQVVTFNHMLQQQLQVLDSLQQNSWTAQQPMQAVGTQQLSGLPGTSIPLQGAPVPASNTAASAAAGAAVSAAPSTVTTALEQEQFQQQFNHHLQQHVQRHLQQQLASGWSLPFGPQAAGMPLQALGGLPYQPFMPNPAALAAAAAAAAAAASCGGAGPAPTQTQSQRTASTGTGATTPMAVGASSSRGFAGSTTDMLAAWGLGGSPALAAAAAAAAAATVSAGDAAAGAASTPRAAPAASPAGSSQQQQQQQRQQQQQQEQLAVANASAATAVVAAEQAAAAYMQQAATAAQASVMQGSSGMHLVSSCAMLDALPAAEQMQMQMAALPKPFSMSDLNALDIPGQIANDLGDLSGLPYPSDGGAGSSAAAAAAAVNAAAAAGSAVDRQTMSGTAQDGGLQGSGMRDGSGGAGGGSGGEAGQQQVAGMPTGFTEADLGQLDMVMDMLR
jgi:hypothetical protein